MGRAMTTTHGRGVLYWSLLLLIAGAAAGKARANECQLTILANDMIQYNARTLHVDAGCKEIELTLRHVGKQEAHVLGHDWVLARTADVSALANAGIAAGFANGYLPVGDKRIIAATKIVGGGESTTITFSTSLLMAGGDYSFFCSYPGHSPMMRGRFQVTGAVDLASNRASDSAPPPPSH
jgi:azurin